MQTVLSTLSGVHFNPVVESAACSWSYPDCDEGVSNSSTQDGWRRVLWGPYAVHTDRSDPPVRADCYISYYMITRDAARDVLHTENTTNATFRKM